MSQLGLKHVVGKHGVEQRALHFDSVILYDDHVVLDVLADFHRFFVFVERAKVVYNS